MLHGYGGRILRIDLTTGKIRRDHSDPAYLKRAIGGRGLNSRRLTDELDRKTDPLSPDNMLLLAVGPLTGSLLTASATMTISGKSPLTGLLGDSQAGGFLGPELKAAGYDQVIITGRSEKPCYLLIADDRVEIKDAGHLWGQDTGQTTKAVRKEINDNAVQVAAIGPAGENLVKFAGVVGNNAPTNDRAGMGCLFGSKQLKAVAVRGTGLVSLADPLTFLDLCRGLDEDIMFHPDYDTHRNLGSTRLMKMFNTLGILPTNHFQTGRCDYLDQVSGEHLARQYKVKSKGCFNCNLHCSRYGITDETEGEGPDYETLCSYTSRIGNDDLKFALRMNDFLRQMGLDPVSSGETIGWAMECVQRGLLTADDLDGLDFTWGCRETISKVLDLIVHRQGIGDWFAEGAGSVARKFGRGTEAYAFHVKGFDIPSGDPRGMKALGLAYAVGSGSGDHLRADSFFEPAAKAASRPHASSRPSVDRLADEGQAPLVEYIQRQALLADCLTICKEIGVSMDLMDLESASHLLTAGTGLGFTPDRVDQIIKDMIVARRQLNLDFGAKPEDDTLPERFTSEPLREGASKGQVVPAAKMVQEYNQYLGWDASGRPPKR